MEALEVSDSNNNQTTLGLGLSGGLSAGLAAMGTLDKYSLRPRSLKKRAETEMRRLQALQQQQQQAALASLAVHPGPAAAAVPETSVAALPKTVLPSSRSVGYSVGAAAASGPGPGAGRGQGVVVHPPTHGGGSQRPSRPKQKPAPLSKYRRKTANARERSRMREINVAFETLRRAVPHTYNHAAAAASASQGGGGGGGGGGGAACASEKLTKITTLRLAMKYIAALTQAVRERDRERDRQRDQDCQERAAEVPDCDTEHSQDSQPYAPSGLSMSLTLFDQPASPSLSPLLPAFDQFRGPGSGCGSASSSSSLSAHGFGDSDFTDHSLLTADFADFPEPSLGIAGIADLVDPCLTAVALTSDDFYDTSFVTDFS